MSYGGSVLPLTTAEDSTGLTAEREVIWDFAPGAYPDGEPRQWGAEVTDSYTLHNTTEEVIAVTANSGYDANTGEREDEGSERELPTTVTLLATPEQSRILAELEADGKLHLSLVYRGDADSAARFIAAQEAVLEELYAPAEENGEEAADGGQETGESSGNPADTWSMKEEIEKAEEALSGSGVE